MKRTVVNQTGGGFDPEPATQDEASDEQRLDTERNREDRRLLFIESQSKAYHWINETKRPARAYNVDIFGRTDDP